jgi:ATP-dependent Zn protease
MIDEEARKFIRDCYDRTLKLLKAHREQMDVVAKELLEKKFCTKMILSVY